MLSARQLLLMGRARDRTVGIAIAPLGTVVLLPDPDVRRRVLMCVSHVRLAFVARSSAEWIEYTTRRRDQLQVVESDGAQGRNRTTDTVIFSHVLYQLSYLGADARRKAGAAERAV